MPSEAKTSAKDYYDRNPSLEHVPGDIWSDLPTFGLLGVPRARGLVVTPACDLANRKVETITYLPLLPIRAYLATPGFRPDIARAVNGQLEAVGIAPSVRMAKEFHHESADIERALAALVERQKEPLSAKHHDAMLRATHGLEFLKGACSNNADAQSQALEQLFGDREFQRILEKIVKNNHADLHFLPADGQREEWSGVPIHSVALFRYTLSLPVVLLERAQDVSLSDWDGCLNALSSAFPVAVSLAGHRPIKRVTLRGRFLSDLITRYVGLFVRLGSPDFSHETIAGFISELKGQ
jgi:hypothetical protein